MQPFLIAFKTSPFDLAVSEGIPKENVSQLAGRAANQGSPESNGNDPMPCQIDTV
jgi:hypothetical protein